jgi:signal peptidase I
MSGLIARVRRNALFEFVFLAVVAVGLAFSIQAYAVKPYRIPSASMEPTLHIGDRVLVNRAAHRLGSDPKIGQIVVFTPPQGATETPARCGAPQQGGASFTPCSRPTPQKASTTFIKRVVAVGGDRISIEDGHVVLNGRRQREPYAAPCGGVSGCDFADTITVPKGYVFLMGDNRGDSDDSRYWGPVPVSWIIGQAFATYWPPGRIGTL